MPMKGSFPIRRTLQYLSRGDVIFKDSVKVMTVNYNTHGELGEGARSVWVAPRGVQCEVDAVEAVPAAPDRNPSATPPLQGWQLGRREPPCGAGNLGVGSGVVSFRTCAHTVACCSSGQLTT